MILFLAAAVLIAAIRKNRVTVLLREVSLLPMLLTELAFWIFQIFAWRGDYRFLPYSGMLQTASLLSLLWPILKFSLYPQAIAGAAMTAAGSMMNRLVMNANGGRMPVYPTLSRLTGYYRIGALEASGDARHMLLTPETKLWFLADYIDVGYSIMSVGDLLIHGFTAVVVYAVIVKLNRREEGN